MWRFFKIIIIGLMAAATSCTDNTYFTIDGEVAGKQSMNLYMRYYGDERLNTGVTAVTEGHFTFKGSSVDPTVVEIMDNEKRVLGRVYITNGEKINVKLDRNNPFLLEAKGGKYNEEWTAFLRENASTLAEGKSVLNNLLEEYIAQHPDNLVSSLLFTTIYDYSIDPIRADSIANMIMPEARPSYLFDQYATQMNAFNAKALSIKVDSLRYRPYQRDTLAFFRPKSKASLLSFTNDKSSRKDSIVPQLKEVSKKKGLTILDYMLVADTSMWKRLTRTDSATWVQAWAPGGVYALSLDQLGIPDLPFFIVVDTAGVQHYRGADIMEAVDAINVLLK